MILKQFLLFFTIKLMGHCNVINSQSHVLLTSLGSCPPNYELRNGLCYPDVNSNLPKCPPQYFLHPDGLCYPKERKPCPADEAANSLVYSTTTEMSTITIVPTAPYPTEIKRLVCPEGSIMFGNKCHKVICPLGEYYRGSCHRPVCPAGLVWRSIQCQKPGFVTTVIEIDNTFVNRINEKPFALEINDHNKIVNHTTSEVPLATISYPTLLQINETSHLTTTTNSYENNNTKVNETCCLVITPRICKKYVKWHCFSRKYKICDNRICTDAILYLEAPEIKYEPPILVMPPNPQLDACNNNTCNSDFDVADCSGCANRSSKYCSPYCYAYICSNKTCTFMSLKDYCSYYPGKSGCMKQDGCLWNWCLKS